MNSKRNNSSIHNFKHERSVEEFIRELNVIIQDVKDKRVDPLTDVVTVQLSKDLSFCRAFIQTKSENKVKTLEGLNSAKNFIKMELAFHLNLRKAPDIVFEIDDTAEKAAHIDELINMIHQKDSDNSCTIDSDTSK